MSDVPDLSTMTLTQRMRFAATVVDDATARGRLSPRTVPYTWEASDLRAYAEIFDAEDGEAAERNAQVEELARVIAHWRGYQVDWCDLQYLDRQDCRALAFHVIESGWRKGESA